MTGVLLLGVHARRWASPGSSSAGIRTRRGRSSSAPSRRGALPVVGDRHRALHPRRRHRRRRDAEPLLRHPRLPHPGDDLRLRRRSTCMLVLRHGISEPPKPGRARSTRRPTARSTRSTSKKDGVPFWPDAAWRDVVFGCADDRRASSLLALRRRAARRSASRPIPSLIDADPRPDWYLLWYFAVLALIPPSLEIVRHPARPRSSSARCSSRPRHLEQGRAQRAAPAVGDRRGRGDRR